MTTAGLSFAPISSAAFADPAMNPYSAYQYLDGYRQLLLQSATQRPLVRLWDENHNFIGQIAQEVSVEAEEIYADTGAASVVIRKDNWLSDQIMFNRLPIQDLHLTLDPFPTQRSWQTRWGGKVSNVTAKRDSQGLHTIKIDAVHNREHLKHILAGANPLFPPELQYPEMWVFPWNVATALTYSLWLNLARQFEPFLTVPTNIGNPFEWLGLSVSNINPLSWPIQPQYINPFLDQSRFEVFASRWSDFHTTSQAILEDAGCIWKAYVWILGEDTTSPNPQMADLLNGNSVGSSLLDDVGGLVGDIASGVGSIVSDVGGLIGNVADDVVGTLAGPGAVSVLNSIGSVIGDFGGDFSAAANSVLGGVNLGEALSMPLQTSVILAVENKSGVTGPFGNFTTGLISAVSATGDDLITDTIIPQFGPDGSEFFVQNNGEGPLVNATPDQIQNFFDVAPAPPFVVFQDGEYSGIVESNLIVNSTTAKTIMVGGKSPGWVNDLITFGVRYGLSQLSDVIQFFYPSGPASGGADGFQPTFTPGLDNLYQGEFDNVVLPFERYSDPAREVFTGTMGFLEEFQKGSGTAYTIAGVLDLRAGDWKTRPFINYKVTVRNAAPYIYNYDFSLGDRVGFQVDNVIYVDMVASAKLNWDINTPVNYAISVGTDYHLVDPVTKALTAIAGIWNLFGMATGSGDLF
jgi:hypothetical protein